MERLILKSNSKVISCGDVIGYNKNNNSFCVATKCSSMVGASRSPYFDLHDPNSDGVGMHLGHGRINKFEKFANRISFLSVNNAIFVEMWTKFFIMSVNQYYGLKIKIVFICQYYL